MVNIIVCVKQVPDPEAQVTRRYATYGRMWLLGCGIGIDGVPGHAKLLQGGKV
jgi:hypothetical protein